MNVPPPPTYFSGTNPPQVPVGLGGGTYMSEESQSEDENENSAQTEANRKALMNFNIITFLLIKSLI